MPEPPFPDFPFELPSAGLLASAGTINSVEDRFGDSIQATDEDLSVTGPFVEFDYSDVSSQQNDSVSNKKRQADMDSAARRRLSKRPATSTTYTPAHLTWDHMAEVEPDMDDAAAGLTALAHEDNNSPITMHHLDHTSGVRSLYLSELGSVGHAAVMHGVEFTSASKHSTGAAATPLTTATHTSKKELSPRVGVRSDSWRIPTDIDHIHDVWNPTADHVRLLTARGACIRRGAWTKAEESILLNNMERAKIAYGTDDLQAHIAKHYTKKSRGSRDFYRMLASGIDRPLQAVYRRFMRQLISQDPTKGQKYTEDDLARLTELHEIHGNNFQAIGEAMGRFPSSVRDRLRVLQGPKGKKWDASEEKRLTEVVLRFTGRDRTELIQADVPWEAVAREMTPRAPHQCQQKWLAKVAWRVVCEARGISSEWTSMDDIALLEHVDAVAPGADELDIDWNAISETFPGVIRTGYMLKQTWKRLKRKSIDPASPPKAHQTPLTGSIGQDAQEHADALHMYRTTQQPSSVLMGDSGNRVQMMDAVYQPLPHDVRAFDSPRASGHT